MVDRAELSLIRGMQYLAERQAAIAHNLANVQSTGFKRRVATAELGRGGFAGALDDHLRTVSYGEHADWTTGPMTATGDKLHVALDGEGFFALEDGAGRRFLSRSGRMSLDDRGRLVSPSGDAFLDVHGQPIQVAGAQYLDRAEIRISPDGTISNGSQPIGQLGVFDVGDRSRLVPAGSARYALGDLEPSRRSDASVRQGNLERSNVQALDELVGMIAVQRGFGAASRGLQALGRMKNQFVQAMNS